MNGEREGLAPRMNGEREGLAPRMNGEREGLAPRMKRSDCYQRYWSRPTTWRGSSGRTITPPKRLGKLARK